MAQATETEETIKENASVKEKVTVPWDSSQRHTHTQNAGIQQFHVLPNTVMALAAESS